MTEQTSITVWLKAQRVWWLLPWALAPMWLSRQRWYQAVWWRAAGCSIEDAP